MKGNSREDPSPQCKLAIFLRKSYYKILSFQKREINVILIKLEDFVLFYFRL